MAEMRLPITTLCAIVLYWWRHTGSAVTTNTEQNITNYQNTTVDTVMLVQYTRCHFANQRHTLRATFVEVDRKWKFHFRP